jgi:hypothetical protein
LSSFFKASPGSTTRTNQLDATSLGLVDRSRRSGVHRRRRFGGIHAMPSVLDTNVALRERVLSRSGAEAVANVAPVAVPGAAIVALPPQSELLADAATRGCYPRRN